MRLFDSQSILLASVCLAFSLSPKTVRAGDINAGSAKDSSVETASTTIQWRDLAPENGRPFNDPFAKLTRNQLNDLSFVMRVRRLIAEKRISADGRDANEANELADKLKQQGVDIPWLMVQRDRVEQIRGLQVDKVAESIGQSLRNTTVSLTGYAIPCKTDEQGRLREFFLVPTVAACSHEEAPPRLQVVFVSTSPGIARPLRSTPVRVTGKIVADAISKPTINASGRVMVHAAYTMSSPRIETNREP